MEVWDEEGEMGRNENRETQGKKRVTHQLLAPISPLTRIRSQKYSTFFFNLKPEKGATATTLTRGKTIR